MKPTLPSDSLPASRRARPHYGFATRSCFNRHEVRSHQLRSIMVGGASILVCTAECEAQARRQIARHPTAIREGR